MPVTSPTSELISRFVATGVWQEQPLHAVVDEVRRTACDRPCPDEERRCEGEP